MPGGESRVPASANLPPFAMTDPASIPAVLKFRSAYGRLCTLAAQALRADTPRKYSAEAVRYALAGQGEHVGLAKLRLQRERCNGLLCQAIAALGLLGVERSQALELCVEQARIARNAVESEWGQDRDNGEDPLWDRLTIPMVQVR